MPYPSMTRRYLSTLLDLVLMTFYVVALTAFLHGDDPLRIAARVVLGFGVAICYEPVLTSLGATAGQAMMGVRVRRSDNERRRISVFRSFPRTLVKALLGWASFLSMGFNPRRRAIHDFAVGSVVIDVRPSA